MESSADSSATSAESSASTTSATTVETTSAATTTAVETTSAVSVPESRAVDADDAHAETSAFVNSAADITAHENDEEESGDVEKNERGRDMDVEKNERGHDTDADMDSANVDKATSDDEVLNAVREVLESQQVPVRDDVRRSPRIAKRVKNPRLLFQEWLQNEPPETVSRMGTPSPTRTPTRSPSRSRVASPAPPASPSPHIGSPHGTVDTEENVVQDDDSESEEDEPQDEEDPDEDEDDDFEPTQRSSQRRRESLFNTESDDEEDVATTRASGRGRTKTKQAKTAAKPRKRKKESSDQSDDEQSSFGQDRVGLPIPIVTDEPVAVPPLRATFDSWSEFYDYLEEYATATHQAIRRKAHLSVRARNQKIDETRAAKKGLLVQHVPETWGTYLHTFICTHGWKVRNRGKGKRPSAYVRTISCPFKFSVYVRHVGGGKWKLVVEAAHYFHNHEVTPEVYKTYAENRGIEDRGNLAKAQEMIEHKRSRKEVYNWLLAKGENVILKDVENMIYKYKNEIKSEDDDTECLARLAAFAAEDDNNVASIAETAQLETGVVSLTSAFMGEMLERFSELLLVDCSHKTNRLNYQLLTIMAIDDYGAGQVVQHSLLERNADWHMSKALDHFVRANPGVAEKVQVLMVDKDLNEIKVLRSYFPQARVLICHFHVIKYLKTATRKPEYGKVSSDDHDTIDAVIHSMVYAATKEVYDENYGTLRDVCTALGYEPFFAYFDANWHSCIDMWVLYTRLRLPHLRVHTNNHLESFFGHLKKQIKPSMKMSEAVTVLVEDDRARANEYAHAKKKIGVYRNVNYDADMNHLLRFTNPFVATTVETEYLLARSKADTFTFTDQEHGVVIVKGQTKEHELNTRTWKCNCSFALSLKLPCQHAIAYRKHEQRFEHSIPLDAVAERYSGLRSCPCRALVVPMPRPCPNCVCSELASISDDDEYGEYLEFVLAQWRNIRQRKRTRPSETGGDESDTEMGPTQLSQPHSLFSDELGDIPIVRPAIAPAVGELYAASQPSQSSQAAPSAVSEADSDHDSEFETPRSRTPTLAFNPRAAVSGRPPLNKAREDTRARESRIIYDDAREVRRTTGEVTLTGQSESISREKPPLQVLGKRLDGLREKHGDSVHKVPKFVVRKNPVLNVTISYVLARELLNKCFAVLPVANKESEAIVVATQSQETPASQVAAASGHDEDPQHGRDKDKSDDNAPVECVQIAGIGFFSRKQIEAMGFLANLKRATETGEKTIKWLRDDIPQSLYEVKPADLADEIASHYPYAAVTGLQADQQAADIKYSSVYALAKKQWLNDDTIAALCARVVQKYTGVRYLGHLSRKSRRARRKKADLEEKYKTRLTAAVVEEPTSVLLLPINVDDNHWTLILIKLADREILYYDSLDAPDAINAMKDAADQVATLMMEILGSPAFSKKQVVGPSQFDGYNCGVLVCHKILQTMDASYSADASSDGGLNTLRYRLLAFILRGVLV